MPSPTLAVDMIVLAAGQARLSAYIQQTFSKEICETGTFTIANAVEWLDVHDFTRWLGRGVGDGQKPTISTVVSVHLKSIDRTNPLDLASRDVKSATDTSQRRRRWSKFTGSR
ncbi:unnamed protein product [Mycena citricolor]|uniref:Uncharacterized protein n=1 Tax=Mycena citricolor TaxID=2018698 RepID=A0AAD2HFF7_9AGAR|nr:unnamed protein product [Mycena citricolor]